jgi:amino acid permease
LYESPRTALILDWRNFSFKGPFGITGAKAKVAGLWDCCTISIFSYTGTELLAITSWETEYSRYTLPKAVRRVSNRIVLYHTLQAR